MLHMMNTKILHIKVILFVVLQCVFMAAVNGQDVTCKAGEVMTFGAIFTSGNASHSNARRRSLLQDEYGNSGERL